MINKLMAAGCLIALTSAPVFAAEDQISKDESAQQSTGWVFGDVDTNHDLKVTEDELKANGKSIAKFKKADLNKDGVLNKEEFVAYAAEEK